jgi:hypothetical protein
MDEFLAGPESYYTGNYPPEYLSPKEKEKPEYGLQYVKAMYSTTNRMGPRYFYDDEEYQSLIEVAQGRQSVENLMRLFGFYRERDGAIDDGSENLAYIDPQVLNLAPKYINRAVAKMQKYSYDISVDAVDPVSIDEKRDYAANIQAFYRLKQWIIDMGQSPKEMFPDLDVDALPQYPDELLYDITVNPKIKKEIAAEIGLKLLHYVNTFKQRMREVDWDIVVIGKGHLHFFLDENGVPRAERINPKYVIGSYVENESYTDQENAGFFDFITVNQLRKEMLADGWSEFEIKQICDKWRRDTPPQSYNTTANWDRYDGLDYIPVLRFYFKSEDNRSFVSMKNNYGTDMLLEKAYNYEPGEEVRPYFERGERKLKRVSYTSIYGGTWVLDSDIIYGYGRKKYPRTNLVNATLPIKSFAPNMKEGRVVSFCAQMIEPLFMINVAWNKIKEIIAKGWMGVREIDFSQLESISMGKGGTVWTPRDVYEHLLKTNTLIKRSAINRYDQQYAGSAVEDKQAGLSLADHFSTLTTAINILEQMTSTSVADSISVPDRLSATAAKQSAQTSDIDMEYLYNAHEEIYREGSHMFLLLLQETKRDKTKIAGFVPAMGRVNTGYYEVPDEIAYCEYGMMLSRQPTEEQWIQFYGMLQNAFDADKIGVSDMVFLMEIDNLKQARQMMAIREKQYRRQRMEEAKFNNDLAIQSNQAAAETKLQGEVAKEQEKGKIMMQVEQFKAQMQERIMIREKELEAEIKGVENQIKERMKRQEGVDSVIKETLRTRADKYKSDKQLEGTIISAAQKSESDQKKFEAPKPSK